MLRIHALPELKSPALLCAFSGWADAANAASGALRYLLLKKEGERIAEFDPDSLYVYTATRPLTIQERVGLRRLQWPELTWTVLRVPEGEHDLVILVGPEPDLRWRECVDAIGSLAVRLGVTRVLTFGGFLAQVHYAGPPAMLGISSHPELRERLRRLGIEESNYQGPTGFVTAVLREASDRGIPAASLWIAAPSYLSGTSNPKLAAALLQAAEQLLDQELWLEELQAAGRDMERRIDEALRARPDLAGFLRRLSGEPEEPDTSIQPREEANAAGQEGEADLPSPEEVLRDLEEHLRRLKEEGNPGLGDG